MTLVPFCVSARMRPHKPTGTYYWIIMSHPLPVSQPASNGTKRPNLPLTSNAYSPVTLLDPQPIDELNCAWLLRGANRGTVWKRWKVAARTRRSGHPKQLLSHAPLKVQAPTPQSHKPGGSCLCLPFWDLRVPRHITTSRRPK